MLQRLDEGVLDRLFSQVEVPDRPDEPGYDPARLLAEDAIDGIERERTATSDACRSGCLSQRP